ncbi:FG-GAP-like repeat-containing protein [Terrabacter sp. NPDC000476]|uniref:FG-GAP-like repeat-containing protein n=1 Tax=Terrabacter sp. NPDC000476 TaxID=3154258 RepID=UPI003322EFC7
MALTALVLGVSALPTAALASPPTAAVATTTPPEPVGAPAGIEPIAPYVPPTSCDPVVKPGTAKLAELLGSTYGVAVNTSEPCAPGWKPESYLAEGRAVELTFHRHDPAQAAQVQALFSWLSQPDARGNASGNARRLGVMRISWDGKVWGQYRAADGWTIGHPSCSGWVQTEDMDHLCHRDRIELDLSWEGAWGRTSYWTRSVASVDRGPCRLRGFNWAAPYTTPSTASCAVLAILEGAPTDPGFVRVLATNSGMQLREGDTGSVVAAVQAGIGAPVTGRFETSTTTALTAWQRARSLPPTGVVDIPTWRRLLAVHRIFRPDGSGPAHRAGLGASGVTALIMPFSEGHVRVGLPNRKHGPADIYYLGGRFGSLRTLVSPGDLNDDGTNDLLSVSTQGRVVLHPLGGLGGAGAISLGLPVTSGWQIYDRVFGGGDFSGDGRPDVIARTPAGDLFLIRGDGVGGFLPGRTQIGRGWRSFDMLFSPGDFTGDRKPDIVGRRTDGSVYVYAGNGRGALSGSGVLIARGWTVFDQVLSAGDTDRDGAADLVAHRSDGNLYLYRGTGRGRLVPGNVLIATGWESNKTVGMW